MVDRRSFLKSNIALAGVLLGGPLCRSAETRTSTAATAWPPETALAIVDRQLDEAEAFISDPRRNGLQALEFEGDVAGLWMRELEPRLRAGPVAMAGYTGAATLFCLDLLARDYGARTLFRVDTGAAVSWILSSSPARRAPLTPSRWSQTDA
jgi:hypothetical protein